jgi:hypothetical protein
VILQYLHLFTLNSLFPATSSLAIIANDVVCISLTISLPTSALYDSSVLYFDVSSQLGQSITRCLPPCIFTCLFSALSTPRSRWFLS